MIIPKSYPVINCFYKFFLPVVFFLSQNILFALENNYYDDWTYEDPKLPYQTTGYYKNSPSSTKDLLNEDFNDDDLPTYGALRTNFYKIDCNDEDESIDDTYFTNNQAGYYTAYNEDVDVGSSNSLNYSYEARNKKIEDPSIYPNPRNKAPKKIIKTSIIETPASSAVSPNQNNILAKAYEAIDKGVFDISDLVPNVRKDLDTLKAVSETAQALGLEDAVYISLLNNATVEIAYLGRETQLRSLRTLENSYLPVGSISLGSGISRTFKRNQSLSDSVSLPVPSLTLKQNLKTGGNLAFSWNNSYSYTKASGQNFVAASTSSLAFTLNQPLLQGAGFEIGRLPLTKAYLDEENNLLGLRSTVIDNITKVVLAYRTYLQQIKQFDLNKSSVLQSREQFRMDKARVEAGRSPKNDLLNSGRNSATNEFTFEGQLDALEESRLALLRTMNVSLESQILPLDVPDFDLDPDHLPTVDEAMKIAMANSPAYLQQLITYRKTELDYMVAQNNTLWALNLTAGITSAGASDNTLGRSIQKAFDFRDRTVSAGLSLAIPVNDPSREDNLANARIAIRTAKINLSQAEENLKQTITNGLQTIKQGIIQLRFARIASALAQRVLDAKRVELAAGRVTNFEYTQTQDTLIQAQNSELNTRISLLNQLTSFDATLGTTLQTWQISLKDRIASKPKFEDTLFHQPEPLRVSQTPSN